MEEKEKIIQLRGHFLAKKETIAVAESVTSGLLQFFFSNIPDAAKFYHGGITAYNIGQKYKHLGVDPIHAQDCNCVSAVVAEQMALNVCLLFSSHWGIGVTGYATPVPESDDELFAHYAIAYKGTVKESGRLTAEAMSNAKVQQHYVTEITNRLAALIAKANSPA